MSCLTGKGGLVSPRTALVGCTQLIGCAPSPCTGRLLAQPLATSPFRYRLQRARKIVEAMTSCNGSPEFFACNTKSLRPKYLTNLRHKRFCLIFDSYLCGSLLWSVCCCVASTEASKAARDPRPGLWQKQQGCLAPRHRLLPSAPCTPVLRAQASVSPLQFHG